MQTMTALVRIAGNLNMTAQVGMVTPAEAWLLMHVHDPDTKDVFEHAKQTSDVERSKVEERGRLKDKYPQHGPLIESLFPGRTAADVPENFDELDGVPLQLVAQAKVERAAKVTRAEVQDAPPDAGKVFAAKPAPTPPPKAGPKALPKTKVITKEESRALFGGRKR